MGHYSTKNEIYIVGGYNSDDYNLADVEQYDIKADVWKKLP